MDMKQYLELSQTPLIDDYFHMRYIEWSKREADAFSRWFFEVFDSRVNFLMSYFDESFGCSPTHLLESIGMKIAKIIPEPQFAEEGLVESAFVIEKSIVLTNSGRALAFDMGLLLAKLLLQDCPSLTWTITRSPKRYAFRNLPELEGFGSVTMCPIMISKSCTYGVLHGEGSGTIWSEAFDVWKNKCTC